MTDATKPIVVLARTAMLGTLFYVFVMYVAFLFIQPELNPIHRFGSEYSVGRMGWLMKLAFFVWGGAMQALALTMARGLDVAARSKTAVVLFVVGGVGVFFAGVFDSDLQVLNENSPPRWVEAPASDEELLHSTAGMVGLMSLMVGAGFATRRLRLAGRLRSKYRTLRSLAWLTPAAFLAFAFFLVSYGLAGLGQRIFLALMLAWQVLTARGLATGAFALRQQHTEPD
jgi:hypothetical protein